MHRFFVLSKDISSDTIIISDPDQAHHLRDVLRIKLKERVVAVDQASNEYLCSVSSLSREVVLNIEKKLSAGRLAGNPRLAVACAIPKNSKMDDIVDKLTQLGVDEIIPLVTERVIVKLDKAKKEERRRRWDKIALSAARQSQRFDLPVIAQVTPIQEALSRSDNYGLKIILTLADSGRKRLNEIFQKDKPAGIYVLIGPEGDFTDQEIASAKKKGFIPATLGELVLRVETAAVAVAGFIRFYNDEYR